MKTIEHGKIKRLTFHPDAIKGIQNLYKMTVAFEGNDGVEGLFGKMNGIQICLLPFAIEDKVLIDFEDGTILVLPIDLLNSAMDIPLRALLGLE